MDGYHEVHSWLQHPSNKTDYLGNYKKALEQSGFKVKHRVDKKGAQMAEGTTPGETHHLEVSKGKSKAYVRHAVEKPEEKEFKEPYYEVEVSSNKLAPTSGHPTDNFRNFLEDSGRMEGLKKALKERNEKN